MGLIEPLMEISDLLSTKDQKEKMLMTHARAMKWAVTSTRPWPRPCLKGLIRPLKAL